MPVRREVGAALTPGGVDVRPEVLRVTPGGILAVPVGHIEVSAPEAAGTVGVEVQAQPIGGDGYLDLVIAWQINQWAEVDRVAPRRTEPVFEHQQAGHDGRPPGRAVTATPTPSA